MCGLFQRETEKAVDHCGKIRYIIVSYSAVRQTDAPLLQTFPEERTVMEQNLTNGSVMKQILRFSLPYLLAYFLQTLYGMADLFIIGQFEGVAGTTAGAVGSQVMHLITVMLVGLAMGSTVLIGRAVGAGDRKHRYAVYVDLSGNDCGAPAVSGPYRYRDIHAGGGCGRYESLFDDLLHRHSLHHGV